MALPTTGLTYHGDASVDTDLWKDANAFANHPADNEEADYMDDVEHGALAAYIVTAAPEWRSGTPLMALPCLDFDGTGDSYKIAANDGSNKALSDVIANSAMTILASVYVEGISTNAAASYDNDALFADAAGFFGIHFKNGADPHVLFYNWDGNEDAISLAISLNTSYVLMYRHEGGNIYASLDGGSETSAASGNTADLSGQPRIGKSTNNKFFNGRLGEIAIYNVALTGSDLTDAISYFTAKWLGVGGGFVPYPRPRGEVAGMTQLSGGIN